MICGTLHVKEIVSLEYGLVNSAEQCLSWQIENKIFLYYLLCITCGTLDVKEMVSLCMICGTLHVKEMVSLNISSFLVRNNLCAGKLSIRSFSYLQGMIWGKLHVKEMVSLI